MNARRELTAAALLCAVGAVSAILAGGRSWATVRARDTITPLTQHVTGRELTAAAVAFGWAGLAGLAALFATRGWGRAAVGALLAALGGGIVYVSTTAVRHAHVLQVAGDKSPLIRLGGDTAVHSTAWWAVSAAGGALLCLGGLMTLVRGSRWPGMSARYERASTAEGGAAGSRAGAVSAARVAEEDPSVLWKSLDRGEDPTKIPGTRDDAADLSGPGGRHGSGDGDDGAAGDDGDERDDRER